MSFPVPGRHAKCADLRRRRHVADRFRSVPSGDSVSLAHSGLARSPQYRHSRPATERHRVDYLDVLNLFHGFMEWGRVLATEEVETVRLDDIVETEGVG